MGQNIVTWVNCIDGGIYGQNIGPDGTMGPIEPIIPVNPCLAPENFEGEYVYDDEAQTFGALLTWTAPETQPLHYNLYRYYDVNKDLVVIEVPGDATSYFDENGIGQYKYQLTAVYEDCESEFALTPDGQDNVFIEITGIEESVDNCIVTVLNVYNMSGQRISVSDMSELNTGVYIIQGLTEDGRLVNSSSARSTTPSSTAPWNNTSPSAKRKVSSLCTSGKTSGPSSSATTRTPILNAMSSYCLTKAVTSCGVAQVVAPYTTTWAT